MRLDLRPLAYDLAQRAGDILGPMPDRHGARRLLLEEIELDHPTLGSAERAQIAAWTLTLLEADDFFGVEYVGDAFTGGGEAEDSD